MNNFKLAILSLILSIFLYGYQKYKHIACNKPGSIAETINFGNKNCPKKNYSIINSK